MKGWNILEREDSTVELQSIKGEELTDVLEEFAVTHQIDPLPVINKSTVITYNEGIHTRIDQFVNHSAYVKGCNKHLKGKDLHKEKKKNLEPEKPNHCLATSIR